MKILCREASKRHLRTPDNLSYKTQYSFCSLLNGCSKDEVSLVEMFRNTSEWQGEQQETVLINKFYTILVH